MAVVGLKNKPSLCYSLFNPPTIRCGTLESIVSFIIDNVNKIENIRKGEIFYFIIFYNILFIFYFYF
jgi:hypothetical protein